MAKRLAISSKEIKMVAVGPKDFAALPRLQRVTLSTDIPNTDIYEIGASAKAGTSKDTPNINLSFSAFDVGIKIFSVLAGQSASAYPAGGADISNLGSFDAILYVKSDSTNDMVKSAHARRLQIQNFAYNYSVGGEATEDYTAIGSEKRWFAYDVVVDKFVAGTTSFTLTQTPIQLKNGFYGLSVVMDGSYLTEVSTAPATGQYRIVGTTLTTFDSRTSQVLVVYHANPAGLNWTDVSEPSMRPAIRGRDIAFKIAANAIPRVQSITINGNLNVTDVKELNNRFVAGYQRQNPTIEGVITVLDTDNELVNLFTNGTLTTSGVVEWSPGDGCTASGINVQVELLDPCDTTYPYDVIKTIYLDGIEIVGDSYSLSVNQNASLAFNYKSTTGHCAIYSGAKA
jgi:hypothetical protein